jgi:hypothetical protein
MTDRRGAPYEYQSEARTKHDRIPNIWHVSSWWFNLRINPQVTVTWRHRFLLTFNTHPRTLSHPTPTRELTFAHWSIQPLSCAPSASHCTLTATAFRSETEYYSEAKEGWPTDCGVMTLTASHSHLHLHSPPVSTGPYPSPNHPGRLWDPRSLSIGTGAKAVGSPRWWHILWVPGLGVSSTRHPFPHMPLRCAQELHFPFEKGAGVVWVYHSGIKTKPFRIWCATSYYWRFGGTCHHSEGCWFLRKAEDQNTP